MTLCLITDRRRLTQAIGVQPRAWREALLQQVAGALDGGVDAVQVRERSIDARELCSLVREVVELCAGRASVLVNDRSDVAIAAGATGVHLREDSIGVEDARRLWDGLTVGRSVHDASGLRSAKGADYVIAGSVYDTASKPGASSRLGFTGLRAVIEAAADVPVWAVGGIEPGNVAEVQQCGARGVAAIGAFIPAHPSLELRAAVAERAHALRQRLR